MKLSMAAARGSLVVCALIGLAGCGGDDELFTVSDEIKTVCAKLDQCTALASITGATTAAGCEKVLAMQALTSACLSAMTAAPCSEHQGNPSKASYQSACWDLCTTTNQKCVDSALHTCYRGVVFKSPCPRVCYFQFGTSYIGSCGTSLPTGKTSPLPICWCSE